MSASHEDIRFKVITDLRESILRVIDHLRTNRPDMYSKLQPHLEKYKGIIEKREDIPLIIKNEKIIKRVGRPDIEVFGGRILIEVKVKISEFLSGFEQLSRYVKFYPYAEYAVITDYDTWEFYRVEKAALTSAGGMNLDYIIEEVLIKGVKVSLSTENVRNMFSSVVLLEEELCQIFRIYGEKNGALFEAYRNIMRRIYEKASEEDVESLFIRHTLMQMIVSSCVTASSKKRTTPTRACSGAEVEIEIVLPYLNWWRSMITREIESSDDEFLGSLMKSIYSKALLLDWESGGKEDIFRELYEILIDAETRREIGEYYTPLWLAEYMTDKVFKDINGLNGKLVLDPFCGSGTFLVTTFYKKVQEGEDPDSAIKEVIGFDINPLAVSIARAELMIAYQANRKGAVTPLVFNMDSASLLLRVPGKWESASFLDELRELEKEIEYVNSPIYASSKIDFSEILKIEMIMRECFRAASQSENVRQELKARLDELKREDWKGALTGHIVSTLSNERSIAAISKLIEKYGNGVWAVSITSLFAPHIIRKVKVDIVITNPPWAQLTEPKGSYGKLVRGKAKELLKKYKKIGQILSGSDISSVLLHGSINIARHEVAFLLPEEVVYTAGSCYGLGKILTYSATKDCRGGIVQVKYDAFQHGRIPCMIFLRKKGKEITCYSMRVECEGEYSKALHLSEVRCKLEGGEDYHDYIKKVAIYTEISSEMLRKELNVEEVVSMGDFIRGLFGGAKKKGAKRYAGLVFDIAAKDKTAGQYSIRLSETGTQVRIPSFFLDPYWKKLIYIGEIFPFNLNYVHNVLLSSKGEEDLKGFLRKQLHERVSEEDKGKIEVLMKELKQPEKLKLPGRDKYYAIYRRSRTFASFVLTP
ncbi:MAG: N-6 DNA methylase, partial [Candidatus Bathyarchaeota archaeon]